jgi:hypothetical protein
VLKEVTLRWLPTIETSRWFGEVEVQVSVVESEDRAKHIAENELRQGKYGHMKVMNVVVRKAEEMP